MKIILFAFALTFGLISSISAQTTTQRLMTVTSDGMEGTLHLSVIVDTYDRANHLLLTKTEDPNYRRVFSASELAQGIVILNKSGHDVVVIRSGSFDVERGGFVVMDYLSNGATKSRQQHELLFEHDGQKWTVYSNQTEVNSMFMQARKLFGNVVGIRSVHINQ
jgi:signal peptidase I